MVASKSTIFLALFAVEVAAYIEKTWLGDTDFWGGDISCQGNKDVTAAYNLCKKLDGCSVFVIQNGRTCYKNLPSTNAPSHVPGSVAYVMADEAIRSVGSNRWWKRVACVDWPGNDRYSWSCGGQSKPDRILKAESVHSDVFVKVGHTCYAKVLNNVGKSKRNCDNGLEAYIEEHNPWSSLMIADNTTASTTGSELTVV